MRRTASQARAHPVGHVNVTPMIDVVMVLIIFYLIVGRLAMERRGQVELPATRIGQTLPEEADPLIVSIDATGAISVGGEPVDSTTLADMIAVRAERGRRVRVRGDRTVPFSAVRPVMDACRKAGLKVVELATEQGS